MPSATRTTRSHRPIVLLAVLVSVVLQITLLPAAAKADDASTVTVVGTSDVFDSNLVTAVLKPAFQAAFPQYTLNYVSKGTGAAIAFAEAGTASGLLVHAASLENQFVAGGFSQEPFGRAIFWGDYVLLGPNSDPVGIGTTAQHDIVSAFQKVAAAGAAGTANFVSRGGTPGTTVQEHAIWALTSGVTLCTVSDANGGGASPSTTTGACPANITFPSWYHATGLTQGPNITNGDACNYPGGNCYVLTDRGTFNFLQSTNAISNLKIVTRDNDAAAPGGGTLLVNSFHAYAISPAKFAADPNVKINLPGVTAFLNWVTSPAGQRAVGAFLSAGGDPPFHPDAAPVLTSTAVKPVKKGGHPFTVSGTLSNVVPGTPALSGVKVSLMRVNGTGPAATAARTEVASATTNAAGKYTITYTPPATHRYYVSVGPLSKIENASLAPVFGDLLAPASKFVGRVAVQGVPHKIKVLSRTSGHVTLKGRVAPAVIGKHAHLSLYARRIGTTQKLHFTGKRHLTAGAKSFTLTYKLPSASWTFKLRYVNTGVITSGFSAKRKVTVH
jgi:tungstate transport system substrate-binding protein